jgi:hypothetical protein
MTDLTHSQMNVLNMGLECLFSERSSTNYMAARRLRIEYGRFVASNFIVLGGLLVVMGRMYKMFRNSSVVFRSPLRHKISPRLNDCRSRYYRNSTLEIIALFPCKSQTLFGGRSVSSESSDEPLGPFGPVQSWGRLSQTLGAKSPEGRHARNLLGPPQADECAGRSLAAQGCQGVVCMGTAPHP